ncbi:DUF1488 domain-containing protein [Dyella sp. A6]|uniref:DUF1488 domain-containing protein n=1 Tax=Dyella aluminiiresistens TaxID=3069105 RepID=UPI002E795DCE|nr:DUF1488 domain-containing protein [Dyella sp. A6]
MDIKFPAVETRSSFDVIFPAEVDGAKVICKVSIEALQDYFSAGADGLPAFKAHRAEFEEKAEQKIRSNQFQEDGTILITTMDF